MIKQLTRHHRNLTCFSNLQVEPNNSLWIFIIHATADILDSLKIFSYFIAEKKPTCKHFYFIFLTNNFAKFGHFLYQVQLNIVFKSLHLDNELLISQKLKKTLSRI